MWIFGVGEHCYVDGGEPLTNAGVRDIETQFGRLRIGSMRRKLLNASFFFNPHKTKT